MKFTFKAVATFFALANLDNMVKFFDKARK